MTIRSSRKAVFRFSGKLSGSPFSPAIAESDPFINFTNAPEDAHEYGEMNAMVFPATHPTYITHKQYYDLMADIVGCARKHMVDLRMIFICISEPAAVPICRDLLAEDVFISCNSELIETQAGKNGGVFISISDRILPQRSDGDNSISIAAYGEAIEMQFSSFIKATHIYGALSETELLAC